MPKRALLQVGMGGAGKHVNRKAGPRGIPVALRASRHQNAKFTSAGLEAPLLLLQIAWRWEILAGHDPQKGEVPGPSSG